MAHHASNILHKTALYMQSIQNCYTNQDQIQPKVKKAVKFQQKLNNLHDTFTGDFILFFMALWNTWCDNTLQLQAGIYFEDNEGDTLKNINS